MTEAELQREVQVMCEGLGLLWHHCNDSRACSGPRGLPDLVIAGRGGLLLPELKSDSRDAALTRGQKLWGSRITEAGGWRLWRPADWRDRTIERQLARIAGRTKEAPCAS